MKKNLLLILRSFLLVITGSAYFAFLHTVFPRLVPFHGGGEGFTLSEANDFTVQIPWEAHSRLHLSLRSNYTIELYVDEINYAVQSEKKPFWRDIVRYFPTIKPEDLHPDMAGIRAKLQGPGDPVRDFVIRDEEDKGLPGFINLVGIESPGLTCSPAIAKIVENTVKEYLD